MSKNTLPQEISAAETVMTVTEVAEYLIFSRDKVYRMVHKDEIPCYRIGTRFLRFKKTQIEEWLNQKNSRDEKRDGGDGCLYECSIRGV